MTAGATSVFPMDQFFRAPMSGSEGTRLRVNVSACGCVAMRLSVCALLLVAALLGDLIGVVVGFLDRVVGALLAGDSSSELLADARTQVLEFRDLHELHAGVRHGLRPPSRRIGLFDRIDRDGLEALPR